MRAAIIVHGLEYFFGAGIQSESPAAFRRSVQMFPLQELDLGRTTVTKEQFEAWCVQQMISGRYSAAAYDLFHRNCNNFSHDAALQGLRLSKGVPHSVLSVPERVLASPMGQMLRPMLQNMQVTRAEGSETVHAPFGNQGRSVLGTTNNSNVVMPINSNSNNNTSTTSNSNPWGALSPDRTPSADEADGPSKSKTAKTTTTEQTAASPKNTNGGLVSLASITSPLLSKETNMLPMCATKMSQVASNNDEKLHLEQAARLLCTQQTLSKSILHSVCQVVMTCFETNQAMTFALFLLRILVMQRSNNETTLSTHEFVLPCFQWVVQQLLDASSSSIFTSPTSRSAAWLTCANAIGTCVVLEESVLHSLIDVALLDTATTNKPLPVRQAACAFLYNAAYCSARKSDNHDELDELQTLFLCSSLSFLEETDGTCRMRKVMVIATILKPAADNNAKKVNQAAKTLLNDLGLAEILLQVVSGEASGADHDSCRKLAGEILALL